MRQHRAKHILVITCEEAEPPPPPVCLAGGGGGAAPHLACIDRTDFCAERGNDQISQVPPAQQTRTRCWEPARRKRHPPRGL